MVSTATKAVEEVYTDDAFWREIEALMAARLGSVSRRLITEGARAAESVGVIVDFDAIHEQALYITRVTEGRYWGLMTQTTRDGLREALITWQEQGLGKRGLPDLIDAIEPLFGEARAKRIAVTEATRLFGEGNELASREDPNVGGLEWQTAQDERVCEICGPLDHNIYPVGGSPRHPAHPNCRCSKVPVSQRYVRAHPSKWQGGDLPPTPTEVTAGGTLETAPASAYRLASSVQEAEDWARGRVAEKVDYSDLTLESANEVNRAMNDMVILPGRRPIRGIRTSQRGGPMLADAGGGEITIYRGAHDAAQLKRRTAITEASYAKDIANKSTLKAKIRDDLDNAIKKATLAGRNPEKDALVRAYRKALADFDTRPVAFRFSVCEEAVYDLVVHEFGHIAHERMRPFGNAYGYEALGGTSKDIMGQIQGKIGAAGKRVAMRISEYAATNTKEHLAEAWAAYNRGERVLISNEVIKVIEDIIAHEKQLAEGIT